MNFLCNSLFSCVIVLGVILTQKSDKAIAWENMCCGNDYDGSFMDRDMEGYINYRTIILESTKMNDDIYIKENNE